MKIQKNQFLSTEGGLFEVLRIALPLIMGAAAHALNLLADRVMLSHYSEEAVAASLTGGLTGFTIACFFLGTIGFTGSFVAQYSGAGATERVGTAVWQGIFLSLIGGAILATGYFWAEPLFALFRHEPEVTAQEIRYFKILSLGNVLLLLNAALGAFWSGRGKTVMVMSVSFLITLMNVPFNYALIYGNWGAPELGIAGAAWGTNLSALVGGLVYAYFFFVPRSSRRHFNTCSNIIDWGLLWRLIRFGVPNGFQFFVDLSAFNIFVIVVGTYGRDIGAATAIAFGLNSIAFTPILGIGQTVAILVGQSIGANDVHRAKKSVKSA
ncbi:MAG: MATE family efflux transporter, partial [Victivallales bacterium]